MKGDFTMNGSGNVLVLGATGQVGKLVATNLKRSEANFLVGREENRIWKNLQMNLDPRDLSISMIHELSMRH